MRKFAGHALPKDPNQWQGEIMSNLLANNPYINPNDVRIQFSKVDPQKQSALGGAVVRDKLTIPIIIQEDKKTKTPHLAPMDVFYANEEYHPLSEKNISSTLFTGSIGKSVDPRDQATSGNPYIGDMTGDVSPMEYTGAPGRYSGPYDYMKEGSFKAERLIGDSNWIKFQGKLNLNKIAHDNWITKIAMHPNDLENFRTMVTKNPDILDAPNADLIQAADARRPTQNYNPAKLQLVQIFKKPDSLMTYIVKFQDSPAITVHLDELQEMFRFNWKHIWDILSRQGKYTMTINLDLKTYPAEITHDIHAKRVIDSGCYGVLFPGGRKSAWVLPMVNFDGTRNNWLAICEGDHNYGIASNVYYQDEVDPQDVLQEFSARVGNTYTFVIDIDNGYQICTVPFMLLKSYVMPDHIIYDVQDYLNGHKVSLIRVPHLMALEKSHDPEFPGETYFVGGNARMVKLSRNVKLIDDPKEIIKIASKQFVVEGLKDKSIYNIYGETKTASVNYTCSPIDARTKLIGHGFMPDQADNILNKTAGKKIIFNDVNDYMIKQVTHDPIEYTPANINIGLLKAAAETGDRETLDTILSLQFVTPDNVNFFVESIPQLKETRTKLAALLVASRIGLNTVDEKSVKTAMNGLDKTIEDLELLSQSEAAI